MLRELFEHLTGALLSSLTVGNLLDIKFRVWKFVSDGSVQSIRRLESLR